MDRVAVILGIAAIAMTAVVIVYGLWVSRSKK